jgi:hypothetical protein
MLLLWYLLRPLVVSVAQNALVLVRLDWTRGPGWMILVLRWELWLR